MNHHAKRHIIIHVNYTNHKDQFAELGLIYIEQIPPSPHPYWILSHIPTLLRIVIAVPVIEQPRIFIMLLPRQANELLKITRFFLLMRVLIAYVFLINNRD